MLGDDEYYEAEWLGTKPGAPWVLPEDVFDVTPWLGFVIAGWMCALAALSEAEHELEYYGPPSPMYRAQYAINRMAIALEEIGAFG